LRLPDSLSPVLPLGRAIRSPALPERFLPPPGFVWGSFVAADGAVLRWGHLPVHNARAECVMVGGFGEFIEKQFETVRHLAARGIGVWCLDWRGQGGSARPRRLPTRPRARNFDRDAEDLAAFAAARLPGRLPRLVVAHSMGAAITLVCLRRNPNLFAAAVLSSPMVGLRTGRVPPTLFRLITRPARAAGLGACFIPGAHKWRPDHFPSPERSRVTTDAERCRLRHAWFIADPRLRLDQATYGWVDSALALVARISKPEFLTAIHTPILFGRAGREMVVSAKALRRAARLLPNCTLVELPESKHDPFLETDAIRDYWLSRLDKFIAERLVIAERRVKTAH
jgi:lysophospholipase